MDGNSKNLIVQSMRQDMSAGLSIHWNPEEAGFNDREGMVLLVSL